MKLVSLNVWGGHEFPALMDFLSAQAVDTDIFCFQEVFHNTAGVTEQDEGRANLYDELQQLLPGFSHHFVPADTGLSWTGKRVDYDLQFGTAIFSKVPAEFGFEVVLDAEVERSHTLHKVKRLQYAKLPDLTVATIHGLWVQGSGKSDIPERLEQSRNIVKVLENLPGRKILIGDLNLNPDTESIRILEKSLRNLIRDYEITSTRTDLYEKKVSLYADYAFVSSDVAVTSLEAPNLPVSDHRPLILEFR